MREGSEAFSPAQFFSLSWNCPHAKRVKKESVYRLPSTSFLFAESSFAEVYMAWNEEALLFIVDAEGRNEEESVDLFLDTRDLKTKTRGSKFSHHFRFTPQEEEDCLGREITRFYGGEEHPLASQKEMRISVKKGSHAYELQIALLAGALYGYDPMQFSRLGFTYRIGREPLPAQHFSVSSREFAVESNPALWATLYTRRD